MIRRLVAVSMLVLAWPATSLAQTSFGIALNAGGDAYFCDPHRDTVWKVNRDGQVTAALTGPVCHAIAIGPDGLVIGEDVASPAPGVSTVGIWRLVVGDQRQWVLVPTVRPDPGYSIIRDASGRSYAWSGSTDGSADSAIIRRDPSGVITVLAGAERGQRDGPGPLARFDQVAGLALANDGSIVVADRGNIRRINIDGTVVTEALHVMGPAVGGLRFQPGLWNQESGIAADSDGSTLVVDSVNHQVFRVDRSGVARIIWRSGGLGNIVSRSRWGWTPAGVARRGANYVVLEVWPLPDLLADIIGSPRLIEVHPDGSTTTLASVSSWTIRSALLLILVVLFSVWRRARSARRQGGR